MGSKFSDEQSVITTRSQLDEAIDRFLQDQLISSFLEIAVGHTVETARRFLQRTDWNIDQAINLFLTNNYDHSMMYHHNQDANSDSTTSGSSDDSDSDFRPPSYLLHENSFEHAKSISTKNNLWLIVNLQSRRELASRTLNRDVWANDAVSRTVQSKFILWQVYNDTIEGQKISTFYKTLKFIPPVVLLIDPITGQKMDMWSGVIEADSFVEDLMKFTDRGPSQYIASLTRNRLPNETCLPSNSFYQTPHPSWGEEFEEDTYAPSWGEEFEDEDAEETLSSSSDTDHFVPPFIGEEYEHLDEVKEEETCLVFPVLTEEPKDDCDRSLVCSIGVRFPDGRRKQRKFLKSEPIQLLWSFCYSHMDESEKKAFKLVQAIPGASKTLDYEANATFGESGLANSMISVTWE